MSVEHNKNEATRWFSTALDDLDAAEIMHDNGKYAHACFLCQQSAEKAIKALYYYHDMDPWGHSILKLIEELSPSCIHYHALKIFTDDARVLDRLYIPTRYPNGLPDIIPAQAYGIADSKTAIQITRKILSSIQPLLT